eukprot:Awhi_evm1s14769
MFSFYLIFLFLTILSTFAVVEGASFHARELRDVECAVPLPNANAVSTKNETYDISRKQWASKMGTQAQSDYRLSPSLIIYCDDENDVVSTISFAKACDYKVSIRAGGHQYAGLSSCIKGQKCLQLDVSKLENFVHNGGNNVTIGVGLTITQVLEKLAPLNLAIPMGICKSVGVGGHFQSSSLGFLGRSFGAGMDLVYSFRIVTADGNIQTVTNETHPELYRAVLGGSPGSWGVILEYTFNAIETVNYPDSILSHYMFPYTHDNFVKILSHVLDSSAQEETARDLFTLFFVAPISDNPDKGDFTHYINAIILYTGVDNGVMSDDFREKHLQPYLDFGPLPAPFPNYSRGLPLVSITSSLQFGFENGEFRYHVHSMSVDDYFDNDFIERSAKDLDERIKVEKMYSSWQIQTYGGSGEGSQLNRNAGKNSFPLRNMKIHLDDWIFFEEDSQNNAVVNFIETYRNDTEKYWKNEGISADSSWMSTDTITAETLNLSEDWDLYYPSLEYFQRLQKVKTEVDPDNLFQTAMTVPVLTNSNSAQIIRVQPTLMFLALSFMVWML